MVVPNRFLRNRTSRRIILVAAVLIVAALGWLLVRQAVPGSEADKATRTVARLAGIPMSPFRLAGNMNEARASFTAVAAGELCVAIGGTGADGRALATWEAFDPAAGRSIRSGVLPEPRVGHTATLLGDGRIFIAGGWDGKTYADRCLILDSTAGVLTEGPRLHFPRRDAVAVALDGRVLIAGGADEDAGFECYDGNTGELTHYEGPGGTLRGAALLSVTDLDKKDQTETWCLLAGGRRKDGTVSADAWLIDTSTMKAKAIAPLNEARADCCVIDGAFPLFVGGMGADGKPLRTTEEFNFLSDPIFFSGPDLVWPVASGAAADITEWSDELESIFVIAGGKDGQPSVATQTIVFGDIYTDIKPGPDLHVARYAPQVVNTRSCAVIMGGMTAADGRPTAECEVYDLQVAPS